MGLVARDRHVSSQPADSRTGTSFGYQDAPMTRLQRYLLGQFLFMFFLSLVFFVLTLVLTDLLMNLSRLLPAGAPLGQIFWLSALYAPQALSWALAPALLFSVSFVLGSLYAHNELVVVLGSGVSLRWFALPLFVVGGLASLFLFFWNDAGVIPTAAARNQLARVLNGQESLSNSNVALLAGGGNLLYKAENYNDPSKTLTGVTLVFKKPDTGFSQRVDAEWADWDQNQWKFHKVKFYRLEPTGRIGYSYQELWSDPVLNDPPTRFQRKSVALNELTFAQAQQHVATLKAGGLPSQDAETDTLQRISFSFSPFVVVWISAAIGGRFRKNILLMSLLASLLISAGFIVVQMVAGLLAKTGFIPPWAGASVGVLVGALFGVVLFLRART
jgi:lipopolysaccharide export system permease protein